MRLTQYRYICQSCEHDFPAGFKFARAPEYLTCGRCGKKTAKIAPSLIQKPCDHTITGYFND